MSQVSGIPYADSFVPYGRLEVYRPFPEATQSVVRHSYSMDWNYEPWLITGMIRKTIVHKNETVAKYILTTHLQRVVESLLAK